MKILPLSKYNGMTFECDGNPYRLEYKDGTYYLHNMFEMEFNDHYPCRLEHIVKSLQNGFWKRISRKDYENKAKHT